MSAGTNSVFHIISFQITMSHNVLKSIWKILFALPVLVIATVLGVVLFVLSIVGKIVMIIPLINLIYAVVFEIIHFLAFFFGLIGNLLDAKNYINEISYEYRSDLNEANSIY